MRVWKIKILSLTLVLSFSAIAQDSSLQNFFDVEPTQLIQSYDYKKSKRILDESRNFSAIPFYGVSAGN